MKIVYNTILGLVIQEVENTPEFDHIVLNEDLELIINSFIKPVLENGEIIEGVSKEEIEEFNKELVPSTISMMKLRMQLILMGTSMGNILNIISNLPDSVLPRIQKDLILVKLEYATHLERYSPELVNLGKMIFTDEQLDYIFLEGNKL